MAAAHMQMRC